jgi:hypothetical protein
MTDIGQFLPLLIPLLVLQLILVVAALWDISRPERRVAGGNKVVWVVVILVLATIGPLAYFLVGRDPD